MGGNVGSLPDNTEDIGIPPITKLFTLFSSTLFLVIGCLDNNNWGMFGLLVRLGWVDLLGLLFHGFRVGNCFSAAGVGIESL